MPAFKILISNGTLSTPFHQQFALNSYDESDLIIKLRGYIGKIGLCQIPSLLHSDKQERTLTCLNKMSSIRIIAVEGKDKN